MRPTNDSDPDQLAARCSRDVAITGEAVRRLMAWLSDQALGPFRPTGAGQSMAAFRARFMSHTVIVHADDSLRAIEREASWTGRAEAWRHGQLSYGPFTEWDLRLAYCHLACRHPLPSRYIATSSDIRLATLEKLHPKDTGLVECDVDTSQPVLPTRHEGHVIWPVGTFSTTVWLPELSAAVQAGAEVTIKRAHLYRCEPILADMAQWVLDSLADEGGEPDPIRRRALKHWSRTIVGRMGLRYREWEPFATADSEGVELGVLFDLEAGVLTDMLQLGKDVHTLGELAEAKSSLPQVTSYVMSLARRDLWRVIRAAGAENVVYMDTDSVITTPAGTERLKRHHVPGVAAPLLIKGVYRGLDVRGPRNLDVGGELRAAGVPKAGQRVAPLEVDGVVWRGLKESMRRGELDHVTVTPTTYRLRVRDPRRHHLPNGRTRPIVLSDGLVIGG